MAQTDDGYLWLGTESGLWRFDGVRFTRWNYPDGRTFEAPVTTLLGSRDGALWIGTATGVIRWKGRTVTIYSEARGVISAILERKNGDIWFTREHVFAAPTLCQVIGTQAHCYGKEDAFPFETPTALTEDAAGALWIGTNEGLAQWSPGSLASYGPAKLKGNRAMGVAALARGPDDSLWVGISLPGRGLGLQRLTNRSWNGFVTPELDGSTLSVNTLFVDRNKSLWVGTTSGGLVRINGRQVDRFRRSDGLSSDGVFGAIEDREGNVWVATPLGLDRFRDLRVTTFSSREGLTMDEVDAVLTSRNGTVVVGGPGVFHALSLGTTYSVTSSRNVPGNQVTALLEDHAGHLWMGIDNTLAMYENGKFRRVDRRNGQSLGFVVGMTEDADRNIWAETSGTPRSLFRIRDFEVQEEFPAPGMPPARQLAADPKGGIWLGLISGDLARYAHGKLEVFPFKQSKTPDVESVVNHVVVNPDGSVMGATYFGVIVWKNGLQRTLTVRNGLPCNNIYATLMDNRENLWLYSQCGLVRIASAELQQWWARGDAVLQVKVLDALDGAQPGRAPFNPAAKSPDGSLWFTNNVSLQMVNPDAMIRSSTPPPVHIEELIANEQHYGMDGNVSLPPVIRNLEIAYTATSLTVPQKVRFRYRLEGHDVSWQEAGGRRRAFYSDLAPGRYRFRVIACNDESLWNEAGAALDFRVLPAWYQTTWFRGLSLVAAALFLWSLHLLHVRQVSHAIIARSDERLAERTRLAGDLHDTVLQTIQASKMVVDHALERPSDPEYLIGTLNRLAVWLDKATREGRAALTSLRDSTSERNDLAEALERITDEGFVPGSMAISLVVIGDVRALHPIVRDEVYRIGHEVIRNAALHSRASRLDIELRYRPDLMLRVSDNGRGMEPAVLHNGRKGHFGLRGMRERADRIGGKLTLHSIVNTGTAVTLVVPEGLAYRRPDAVVTVAQRVQKAVKGLMK